MAEPTWTMFEIAAGAGMLGHGVSIALKTLGIRTDVVGGCEWESCAAAAFMEGVEIETGRRPAVWDDARTFAPRRWRSRTGSVVDIIAAGYPCQPFSAAGRRAGAKDARHLWPACRRIVARLKPSIVFLENVDSHVTMGLWKVIRDCERLGYRTTAGVYSSEEVGAPHLRKRVFILGLADPGWRDGQSWPQRQRVAVGAELGDSAQQRQRESHDEKCSIAWRNSRCDNCGAGGELGDTERHEHHEPRPQCERSDGAKAEGRVQQHGRAGHKLAQCQSPGQRAGGQSSQRDGQSDRGGEELDDTDRPRAPADACDGQHRGEPAGGQVRERSDEPAQRQSPGQRAGGSRPIFPPGRTDFRRWAELAAGGLDPTLMPAIESGVSVVADGMASASDLLRLGGNGVNPLQAAWAFLTLAACLMDDVETPDDIGPLFAHAGDG